MFRNLIILFVIALSTGYAIEAVAIPPIKSQDAIGEEAESIEIQLDANRSSGQARVEGCIRCPLTLQIDKKTRFFESGKPITPKEAEALSGRSGTIIFEHDRTLRIRW